MSAYHELYWSSPDGLRLHARDVDAPAARFAGGRRVLARAERRA